MASKFQNRLVGTIILVAIGVIVLPDFLDGKKTHYQDDIASIPIKPSTSSDSENYKIVNPVQDTKSLPKQPVEVTVDSGNTTAAANQSGSVNVEVKQTTQQAKFKDNAWIIQLMALKNADNAKNVVKDLQKRGYQAHSKKENGFTRVIIGPNISKQKLQREIVELEKITGSKGRLLKFNPLNP
ncbi:SPOR domain-containing protein [Vibrio marisflavi]|uniref:Cell division protein DedD n=1 Tax=Vibrio marisflavi CECT 7928 TaxID=634439 RepID=A0ABM9A693_9VIBR|nr:SPOR domain-containing protein [Vibrio marisflavi]CAH0540804.1 Cell division protein DedD [Vibrio marisflavi CECT 7928]